MLKSKKTSFRFFRFFLIFIITFFLFIIIASTIVFTTNYGQNASANLIANYMEHKIQSKVLIGSAEPGFHKIRLNRIQIYDHKDSLFLEIPRLTVEYALVKRSANYINFKKVSIENAYVNAVRHSIEESFNFEYIIRKLIPEESKGGGGKFFIKEIELKQSTVRYWQPETGHSKGKFDYEDIYVRNVNILLHDFRLKNGDVYAVIKHAEGIDKSGLSLHDVTGKLKVGKTVIRVNNFHLLASNSDFYGDFAFIFEDYKKFQDFIPNITMQVDLDKSKVDAHDLAYFVPDFASDHKMMLVKGNMKGTVDNLRVKNVVLDFGESSVFKGNLKFNGLPDINETLIDVDMKSFDFSFADLNYLIPVLDFPEDLYNTGNLRFVGRYTGFIRDFVAYGKFYSPYGEVYTDINFKIPKGSKIPGYSGIVTLTDFDLGKFLSLEPEIGKTTLTANVRGSGIVREEINTELEAQIDYFEYHKYTYSNISVKGDLGSNLFNGYLNINDENADVTFKGTIDLNKTKPLYNFTATLKNTDLHKLNFLTDKLEVNCMLDISLSASTLDDIEGRVLLLNGNMITHEATYPINTLVIDSKPNDKGKNISLNSDIIEATITGDFLVKELPDMFKMVAGKYMDTSFHIGNQKNFKGQNINFDINLIQTAFINKLLKSKVFFSDDSKIKGNIDLKNDDIRFNANIPELIVKNYKFNKLLLNAKNRGNALNVWTSVGKLVSKDSALAEDLNLAFTSSPQDIDFNLYLFNRRYYNHVNLAGKMSLKSKELILALGNSSIITKNNLKWEIISDTITVNYKPDIKISYFELKHEDHIIKAIGNINKEGDNPLRFLLDNVEFNYIKPYIPVNLDDFSGVLNGQLVIFNVLGNPYFDAAFSATPIQYDSKTIGLMTLTTNHQLSSSKVNIAGSLYSLDMEEIMEIGGFVDLSENKSIDLNVSIPPTQISNYAAFADFMASEFKGEISGDLSFTGPLDNYKIKGTGYLSDVSFKIDYTKVTYTLSHTITIDEHGIYMNNATAYDEFGHSALIFGEVKHNYFQDIYLNIGIIAENLYGLNTQDKDDPVYFGKAFASGRVDITGPLDAIMMDLKVKSEPGTKISLKAYDEEGFGNHNFIYFTNSSSFERIRKFRPRSDIAVNIDMEITPEAEAEIIFDPVTNDLIKANGNGTLKFAIDFAGNTSMFGTFYIDEGEYTFNALGLLKKKFLIREGSSIVWRGDVFEAQADIEAYNKLDASVYNLVKDNPSLDNEQKELFRQKSFPVEAKLKLTGSLFNPDVALDFDVLNLTSAGGGQQNIFIEQQIKNIKNNEQELNKQVISLLVLNSFLPPETGIGEIGSSGLNANVGSIFSSQINQWLSEVSGEFNSKYISNVQVGVNYVDENENFQKELDFLLGGSLFNDRVELSGSYDVENINANFQASFQLKKDRKMRLKVFSRSDNNPIYRQDISRQGLGIYVKEDFDTWGELFKRH